MHPTKEDGAGCIYGRPKRDGGRQSAIRGQRPVGCVGLEGTKTGWPRGDEDRYGARGRKRVGRVRTDTGGASEDGEYGCT